MAFFPGDVKQLPVTQTDISVESKFIQVNRVAKAPFTRWRVQSDGVIVTGLERCTVSSADIQREAEDKDVWYFLKRVTFFSTYVATGLTVRPLS